MPMAVGTFRAMCVCVCVPARRYNIDAVYEGTTPLARAICASNLAIAKVLLQAGADPLAVCSSSNSEGSTWTTPLHYGELAIA